MYYKISGIFSITNKLTGKKYIGQSINVYARWKQILTEANTKENELYSDIRKYGIDNFEFKVIEKCPIYSLNNKQKNYIALYNTMQPNGYNKNKGGSGYAY